MSTLKIVKKYSQYYQKPVYNLFICKKNKTRRFYPILTFFVILSVSYMSCFVIDTFAVLV